MHIYKGAVVDTEMPGTDTLPMIISKLLLSSKGILGLHGFDDHPDFASKHRRKCE